MEKHKKQCVECGRMTDIYKTEIGYLCLYCDNALRRWELYCEKLKRQKTNGILKSKR